MVALETLIAVVLGMALAAMPAPGLALRFGSGLTRLILGFGLRLKPVLGLGLGLVLPLALVPAVLRSMGVVLAVVLEEA